MNIQKVIDVLKFRTYSHFYRSFKLKVTQKNNRIFLFGTIEHMNYGDIAINVAEYEFFRKYFPGYEIVEIPERFVHETLNKVRMEKNYTDIICFHGGGNMGDIWEDQEPLRREVFDAFKNDNIISLPQSTSYFDRSDTGNLYQDIKTMANNKKLIFFARDKNSFEVMKENFPDSVDKFLVPDMALSLNRQKKVNKLVDITTFFRRDKEKNRNLVGSRLIKILKTKYEVNESDTVGDYLRIVNPKTRNQLLEKKLQEFRNSKIVITDRLHGMILATITGTPVIVYDNNNHKIKHSYYDWLKDIPYVFFADEFDNTEVLKIIESFVERDNVMDVKVPDFEDEFVNMAEIIKNKIIVKGLN